MPAMVGDAAVLPAGVGLDRDATNGADLHGVACLLDLALVLAVGDRCEYVRLIQVGKQTRGPQKGIEIAYGHANCYLSLERLLPADQFEELVGRDDCLGVLRVGPGRV